MRSLRESINRNGDEWTTLDYPSKVMCKNMLHQTALATSVCVPLDFRLFALSLARQHHIIKLVSRKITLTSQTNMTPPSCRSGFNWNSAAGLRELQHDMNIKNTLDLPFLCLCLFKNMHSHKTFCQIHEQHNSLLFTNQLLSWSHCH